MEQVRNTFKFLEMNRSSLTPGQIDFVKSLKNYFKSHGHLTLNQIKCLSDIARYIKIEV